MCGVWGGVTAGSERFKQRKLPHPGGAEAAAKDAAAAAAAAELGGPKLGTGVGPWAAGPGLLWHDHSLVHRPGHVEVPANLWQQCRR